MRILITGNAGSGKTSVGKMLAARLGLPYVGLDGIVWKAGWGKTPAPERRQMESRIASSSAWVVDGVSTVFLEAADVVIFLDVPRHRCYWRVFRRNLPFLFRSRPGMPERCPEILIVPRLLGIIWRFPGKVAPGILARQYASARFFHVRNGCEFDAAMAGMSAWREGLPHPGLPL